jgi:hypothetical protein
MKSVSKCLFVLTLLFGVQSMAQISVQRATYGANCGAWNGNATNSVSYQCNGRQHCDYYISVSNLGDPAPGCPKNFDVTYSCGHSGFTKTETAFQEANGKSIRLSCGNTQPSFGINVRSATYGGNVGASYGNVTSSVSKVCAGKNQCSYYVSVQEIGDPVPGAEKDFRVDYTCPNGAFRQAYAAAEANGSFVQLNCF